MGTIHDVQQSLKRSPPRDTQHNSFIINAVYRILGSIPSPRTFFFKLELRKYFAGHVLPPKIGMLAARSLKQFSQAAITSGLTEADTRSAPTPISNPHARVMETGRFTRDSR